MTVSVDLDNRPSLSFYLSVGLVAGSIIALQIGIMRVFSVGSWAHFGSLVVSLAMFGFGLTSAVMCVGKGWFERHWIGSVKGALLAFGPALPPSAVPSTLVVDSEGRLAARIIGPVDETTLTTLIRDTIEESGEDR